MAAVMGATYPDLYAAVGIHSGLPYRSAQDVSSALAAMRGNTRNSVPSHVPHTQSSTLPRQIVFHGTRDHIVVPTNAKALMDAARLSHPTAQVLERSFTSGSRLVMHTELLAEDGLVKAEAWLIDGASHYWSGGDPRGSYAKPDGPNASKEMVRFFLGQRHSG
jgi:poly(3-hydroxybutyrate) depolymerase